MGKPKLFGADYSVYVRIVRLTLAEKGVDYESVPVDVFAADGLPAWYLEHQPFGRIPAFEHDGFRLFETTAITRYVDEAFAGPPLQPADARQRATMNQIIGLLDAYAYRAMVWDVYVERIDKPNDGKVPDEALIGAGLEKSRTCLAALSRLKAPGDWLLGDQLTLADLHAAPMFGYFVKAPEAAVLLAEHPEFVALVGARVRRARRVARPRLAGCTRRQETLRPTSQAAELSPRRDALTISRFLTQAIMPRRRIPAALDSAVLGDDRFFPELRPPALHRNAGPAIAAAPPSIWRSSSNDQTSSIPSSRPCRVMRLTCNSGMVASSIGTIPSLRQLANSSGGWLLVCSRTASCLAPARRCRALRACRASIR